MHRDYGSRSLPDLRLDLLGIDIECDRIDIRENGSRSQPGDATCSGEECEWRDDDFITRPNIECVQGQDQCVRPRTAADAEFRPTVCCEFLFEGNHFRPE